MRILTPLFFSLLFLSHSFALPPDAPKSLPSDKFKPLAELLPTPTEQRTASGAPGKAYWQQQADHEINVEVDETTQGLKASETITYHNNSPDTLTYLWLELDPNLFAKHSAKEFTEVLSGNQMDSIQLDKFKPKTLLSELQKEKFDGSLAIDSVTDSLGKPLSFLIADTMMKIDLPTPLASGSTLRFNIRWHYQINDGTLLPVRTGYEYFQKDKNYIFEVANWYPRMCSYTDVRGWQNKAYLGVGEFSLEFGNYLVKITLPEDHIVSASGELQNSEQVLTATQRERLKAAATAKHPVFIVTPEEAKKNEAHHPSGKKTWVFKADNIRTFAFASSRKFIWDAQGVPAAVCEDPKKPTIAMSFYPKEAEPLWSKYSTQAVLHTLEVYTQHTFPFPYPTVNSVNGPIFGMEFSMICFNGTRPEKDGTYSKETKEELIAVIIHEVGHNFFPMIVNSDEREWAWMDEGLNSFLEHLATDLWEKDFKNDRCVPRNLPKYMNGPDLVPIMTTADSILKLGGNAYAKPAGGLNLLRNTILGPERFDFAFKVYANRWKFKRPEPADFFRTISDASGCDLDWFWRGWFYSIDPCSISVDTVHQYILDTGNPTLDKPVAKKEKEEHIKTVAEIRDANVKTYVELHPELQDFYSSYDVFSVLPSEQEKFKTLLKALEEEEIDPSILTTKRNFYVIDFSNRGGLIMPIPLKIDYTDGTSEERRIPAEIWRTNNQKVSKLLITTKELKSLQVDPHEELPESHRDTNFWPRHLVKDHFQFKQEEKKKNPMQELQKK
ncbi:MAG: M1 family metallopeptidase [Verrucomicrobiae bacterium]|nr:M1 family metallopeptidase [Verrucomicrobiae bacterium]